MNISNEKIDGGKEFDWGRVSREYAAFRDIYPQEFYDHIVQRGLCVRGQRVLDLGTGTGVLPRNLYRYDAHWTGTDISPEQIAQAKRLSEGMDIDYLALPSEQLDFPDGSFDVITACQCFWYFDHEKLAPKLHRMLKPGGKFLLLCMEWLPFEDAIAGASEQVILKYSPDWTGAGETMHPIAVPDCYLDDFTLTHHEEYLLPVHFTRAGWHGRIRACRGVGASLAPAELEAWETEHRQLLERIAPDEFDVLHYAALAELTKKE